MQQLRSVLSPTLDSAGRFAVQFGDGAQIAVEQLVLALTANLAIGATTISVPSTFGLSIGEVVTIADNNGSEVATVATIPTPTTFTVAAIARAYTIAANGRVSIPGVGKIAAWVTDPFTTNQLVHLSWTKDVTLVSGTAAITNPTPPVVMSNGALLVTVGGAGDVYITLPPGASGTAVSGTAAVTGTPKALNPGPNLITLGGAGNFTVNLAGLAPNAVVVTCEKATTAAGAGTFAVCVTADMLGQTATVLAEIE